VVPDRAVADRSRRQSYEVLDWPADPPQLSEAFGTAGGEPSYDPIVRAPHTGAVGLTFKGDIDWAQLQKLYANIHGGAVRYSGPSASGPRPAS
jgi:hypothetical protein